MQKVLTASMVSFVLVGCAANSGVAPIGQNTFMVSRQAATGFSGSGTLKADALTEANQYCASQQKSLFVLDAKEAQPPYVLGNYPKAEVQFMCLDANDARLAAQANGASGWSAVINSIMAECNEKRLKKEVKGFVGSVRCSSPKVIAAWRQRKYPYMDLVDVYEAARLVGAENVDKGRISEAEYNLQLAELRSRFTAEGQRRSLAVANTQAAQAQAQAANTEAAGALLQGLGALQAANRQTPYQMPTATPQRSINCTTTGPYAARSTNCY
jgi:hypothetical protein